jgi:uncharacterized repeat protein (TIGR03803 family)
MRSAAYTILLLILSFPESFAATTYSLVQLHRFLGGSASGNPQNQLIQDAAGNLYGTTSFGGNMSECGGQGCGVVFRLSFNGTYWIYTELFQFNGTTGPYPSNLILDAAGNLYGELGIAGPDGAGLVFELSPTSSGPWKFTTLYSFTGSTDGDFPNSGLVWDTSGNLFGTTMSGGQYQGGTVFELSPSHGRWTETVIWSFSKTVFCNPYGTVVFDANGNIYGVAGAPGNGAIYKLTQGSTGWTADAI